jgi:hypothetical protein
MNTGVLYASFAGAKTGQIRLCINYTHRFSRHLLPRLIFMDA